MAREKIAHADPEPMCAKVRLSPLLPGGKRKMSLDTIGLLFIAAAFVSVPISPYIAAFVPMRRARPATIAGTASAAPPQSQARTVLEVPEIGLGERETGPAAKAFQTQDKRRVTRPSPSFWSKDANRALGQVKIGPCTSQLGK
jgi:hypothetical protein